MNVYQTEPYVVAADVYGEPPHVGRGGWTWYTGSAGWMFRVAVESIFGVSTEGGDTLVINPSISSAWPQCRLTYRLPDGKTSLRNHDRESVGQRTRRDSARRSMASRSGRCRRRRAHSVAAATAQMHRSALFGL